jgi:hypothetical protein
VLKNDIFDRVNAQERCRGASASGLGIQDRPRLAHPVVGDTTHGKGEHNRAVAQWPGTRRLWLHA